MRGLFSLLMVLTWLAAFGLACTYGASGNWLVPALVPIMVSPVMMRFVRYVWEDNQPGGMFNPKTQSWAFMFGDTIAIPIALGFAAVGWRTIESESWFRSPLWLLSALLFGVLFAGIWHFVLETNAYNELNCPDCLRSESKRWHDLPVYASLGGAMFYLGIPAVAKDFTGAGWVAMMGFIGWVALGIFADNLLRDLVPTDMHPPKPK